MTLIATAHQSFRARGRLCAVASWFAIITPLLAIAGRAPTDIGVSLVAVLFIAHAISQKDRAWLQHHWVRGVLVLWLYMMCAALFAEDAGLAFGRAAAWVRYPLFAIALAYWILHEAEARKWLLYAAVTCLLFLISDGFLQYATGTDLFGRALLQFEDTFRLTGPFSNQRLGITLVWLCFAPACYMLSRGRRGNAAMLLGITCMAATMTLVYVTGERMANLLMACGAVALLLLCTPLRLRITLATLLALASIGLLTMQNDQLATRQLEHTSTEVVGFFESPYARAWESAIMVWQSSPAIGVGAKHFERHCQRIAETTSYANGTELFCPIHPHHVLLEWLVYYGAIGFLLFACVVACWLQMAWRGRHMIMGQALACGLFITLCIRFFPLASTASQFTAWSAMPLWLCVGWLVALLTHQEHAHADRSISR